jgi:hypothetical protein
MSETIIPKVPVVHAPVVKKSGGVTEGKYLFTYFFFN